MNHLKRIYVWLYRLPYCRGFGIQSPTDYAFVRYVINEHWPYYAYDRLGQLSKGWLDRKIGRLYFRLANWRQPSMMRIDPYGAFFTAGCMKTKMVPEVQHIELERLEVFADYRAKMDMIYNKVDDSSVLVIDKIYRDMDFWHDVEKDSRTSVTFDLYYCGIVFFDKKRHKMNYKVNF